MGLATIAAIAREIKKEEERHRKKLADLKKKKEETKRGFKW